MLNHTVVSHFYKEYDQRIQSVMLKWLELCVHMCIKYRQATTIKPLDRHKKEKGNWEKKKIMAFIFLRCN